MDWSRRTLGTIRITTGARLRMRCRGRIHWHGNRKRPRAEKSSLRETASSVMEKTAAASPRKMLQTCYCRKFNRRAMEPFSGNSRMEIPITVCLHSADCRNCSAGNWYCICELCTLLKALRQRMLHSSYTIGSRCWSAHHAQGTTIHMLKAPQAIDRSLGGAPAARLATHPKNRKTSNAHNA